MELWKELLINGLQNDNLSTNYLNNDTLKEIIENNCYKVLLQIKNIINNDNFSDKDCFIIIEKIINNLEQNNIFCERHDFG